MIPRVLALLAATAFAATTVEYQVESPSAGGTHNRLTATIAGKPPTLLIAESEERCLAVFDQRDFNNDGTTDALIEWIQGCGGNCCANSFFFYSQDPKSGRFTRSEAFGNAWDDPVVEPWQGRPSIRIVSRNEGMNTDNAQEITERYILNAQGRAVRLSRTLRKELPARAEMRSSQLKPGQQSLTLAFDLNADGKPDRIIGELWERWGRLRLNVQLSGQPAPIETEHSCKRIGVLATKTRGVHDLVCDHDTVIRWNGAQYR